MTDDGWRPGAPGFPERRETMSERDYLEDNIATLAFHLGQPCARLSISHEKSGLVVEPGEVLKEAARRLGAPAATLPTDALKEMELPWEDIAEDDPDVVLVAHAIAEHGIGRDWNDFLATDAYGVDHGDLIEYARAAVAALRAKAASPSFDTTAAPGNDQHYLSAIRVRLEQLYDVSAGNPRLREQLSDEVDWVDAQLEWRAPDPVAWRWRPRGATCWIYNPDAQWLAEHKDEVETEPLYTAVTRADAKQPFDRSAVIEECAKVCEDLRHEDYSAETSEWSGGTFDCARAIRAMSSVSRGQS